MGVREKINKYLRPVSSHKENLNYGASSIGFAKAKVLRRNMTKAEKILWKHLRNRNFSGYKFRRQHPLGIYIADFYSHNLKLVIEIDGSHYYLPDEKKYDTTRTFTMNHNGINVIRFSNADVLYHIDSVLQKIEEETEKYK